MPSTLREMITSWSIRRDEMRRLKASVDGETICDQLLRDLEEVSTASGGAIMTLSEAAKESGYTVEHLGRLIRSGKLQNAGRKGAPRVFMSDLPRRSRKSVAGATSTSYDLATDARFLRARR